MSKHPQSQRLLPRFAVSPKIRPALAGRHKSPTEKTAASAGLHFAQRLRVCFRHMGTCFLVLLVFSLRFRKTWNASACTMFSTIVCCSTGYGDRLAPQILLRACRQLCDSTILSPTPSAHGFGRLPLMSRSLVLTSMKLQNANLELRIGGTGDWRNNGVEWSCAGHSLPMRDEELWNCIETTDSITHTFMRLEDAQLELTIHGRRITSSVWPRRT